MLEHRCPHLVEAGAGLRRTGQHRGSPHRRTGQHQPQSPGELASRHAGRCLTIPIGLVDGDDVGELEDAALDALELVTRASEREEQEGVDHLGHRDLVLADPHGLDDDDVVTGSLQHEHGLPRRPGDAAEVPTGRAGPDEGRLTGREAGHPGAVAEDRAARTSRAGVDRDDGHRVPALDEPAPHRVDEGRLAHSGDTRDADPHGAAGGVRDEREELPRELAVVGAAGLEQGDGAGDVLARSGADPLGEVGDVDRLHPSRSRRSVTRSMAARLMTVPGG